MNAYPTRSSSTTAGATATGAGPSSGATGSPYAPAIASDAVPRRTDAQTTELSPFLISSPEAFFTNPGSCGPRPEIRPIGSQPGSGPSDPSWIRPMGSRATPPPLSDRPSVAAEGKDGKICAGMSTIERRLVDLGIVLPQALQLPPGLVLPFPWVRVVGTRAIFSGHGPTNPDGSIAQPLGKVGADLTLDQAVAAARLTGLAILGSLHRELGSLDRIAAW